MPKVQCFRVPPKPANSKSTCFCLLLGPPVPRMPCFLGSFRLRSGSRAPGASRVRPRAFRGALFRMCGKTRGPRGPGAPNHGKNACDRGTLRASVGALVFPQGLQGAPSGPPDQRCTGLGPISCEPGRNRAVGRPSVRRGRIGPHGLLGGPEPPSVRPGRVFGDFACVFPLRLACAGVPKPASRAVEGAWAAPGSLLAVPGPALAVPGRS